MVGSHGTLDDEMRAYYEEWLEDDQILLHQSLNELRQRNEFAELAKIDDEDEQLSAWIGGDLPPIEIYRVPYDLPDRDLKEADFDPILWLKIVEGAERRRKSLRSALATGKFDDRHPIEPTRRAWFQRQVDQFDPAEYPDNIPAIFEEGSCSVFGHVCPVFFTAEAMTETKEERRIGRRSLNFKTMMRIVRRDDYRCQHCRKKLEDTEVEFDHIIPVSRGGSSEEHNLRLTCYDCNRDKSDDFTP